MTGLALNLGSAGGATLDFTKVHSGVELDLQNAVVNVMTRKGSDIVDTDRGTDLTDDVVSGYITSLNGARHAANFAALETMRTLRAQSPPVSFSNLVLAPINVSGMALNLEMTVVDSAGNPVLFSVSFQ